MSNENKKDDAIIIETNFRDEMVQEALNFFI